MTKQKIVDYIETLGNQNAYKSKHEILDLIRKNNENLDKSEKFYIAEIMAFEFNEDSSCNWGTYYGPSATFKNNKDNSIHEFPNKKEITPEVIQYWKKRAKETEHPLLKARYADLVYDFTKNLLNKNPDYHYSLIAIENILIQLKEGFIKNKFHFETKISRALFLATSTNQKEHINTIKSMLFSFPNGCQLDSDFTIHDLTYDLLVKKFKKHSNESEISKIISNMENEVKNLMHNKEINPWDVEDLCRRLAEYYNAKQEKEKLKNVLQTIETAFQNKTQKSSSILQQYAWLNNIHNYYQFYNFKEHADRIKKRLRAMGPDTRQEMKAISHKIEVTSEQIDQFISQITSSGNLEDIFFNIAYIFIPKKDEIEKELFSFSKKSPLLYHMPKQIVDEKGRSLATIGSLESDLEGKIIQHMDYKLKHHSIYLRKLLTHLEKNNSLNIDTVKKYLLKSPLFDNLERQKLIDLSLNAYFNKEFEVTIHILIPQIEYLIRDLLERLGGVVLKQKRDGSFQLRTFDDILRDPIIKKIFEHDTILYFRMLFTDPRGWNTRNKVCHGMTPPGYFNQILADRLFHALLCLGGLRNSDNGE